MSGCIHRSVCYHRGYDLSDYHKTDGIRVLRDTQHLDAFIGSSELQEGLRCLHMLCLLGLSRERGLTVLAPYHWLAEAASIPGSVGSS